MPVLHVLTWGSHCPWDCHSFCVVCCCSSGFWSQLSGFLFWQQKTSCKLTFTEITVRNLVSSLDLLSPSAYKITVKDQQTMKMAVLPVRVYSQLPVFSFSGGHLLRVFENIPGGLLGCLHTMSIWPLHVNCMDPWMRLYMKMLLTKLLSVPWREWLFLFS